MTEHQALLHAVCLNPADDLPRLVYADWLEEHGRAARAEFIRLQCALHRKPAGDPEVSALRSREAVLLREHRAEWAKELPALRGVEWSSLWVRGFVDTVLVNGGRCFVNAQESLFAASAVTRVTLSPLTPADLPAVLDCPHLRRVERLRFALNDLTDRSAEELAGCEHLTGLRALDLSNNRLTDRGVLTLLKSPFLAGLRELNVSGNRLKAWPQNVVDEGLRLRAKGGPVG